MLMREGDPVQGVVVDIDKKRLDQQLNIGAAYPDLPQRLERWRTDSAALRQEAGGMLDVAYGPAPREKLDYFPCPDAIANVVFIHGGSWRVLDKETFSFVARALAEARFNAAIVGYPQAPAASLAEIVDSVCRSLSWLASSPDGPAFDSKRTAVIGHSAGGHLATMAALTDWSKYGLTSAPFVAGCSIGGLYDIETVRHSYLNDDLKLDQESAAAVSPLALARKVEPSFLLAIAEHESPEFQRQHREFAERWRASGQDVEDIVLPGDDHFSVLGSPISAEGVILSKIAQMVSAR